MNFYSHRRYAQFLFFIVFLLFSCKKENLCDCFKGTGKDIREQRILPAFDKLYVEDRFEVYIKEDTAFLIQVEGGENLIPLVKTSVENNTLKITYNNKCNAVRSYKRRIKVYISAPRFSEITQNGVGNIYSIGALQTDSVYYHILNSGNIFIHIDNTYLAGGLNGMGDFYGSGKTFKHICNVNGESWVDCRNLETEISDLYMKTSGSTYITVNQSLNVIIKQSGNVYYNGNPAQVIKQIDGTGKLIQGY